MVMRQIRTSNETRAMMEKLRTLYLSEKFASDDMVTMTVGYILNTAYNDVEKITDWNVVIDASLKLEDEFWSMVKDSKTPITRFRLSEVTSEGIDALTKQFADKLGLKVQIGFTVKQILKAAILLREGKKL